ncbi:MAG: DUF1622 domain-containing protein [Nitrospirae bacterium]|nr:MAG: DUF1622 domain-containing protein [Nitrospirota bacterium]
MHEFIKTIAQYIAAVAEGIAVLFIVSGIIGAVIIYVRKTFIQRAGYRAAVESRHHLGHSLSLALEFLIGADILKTAISPSWQDIGQLAAIVGIRTILNFFLTRELKQMELGTIREKASEA